MRRSIVPLSLLLLACVPSFAADPPRPCQDLAPFLDAAAQGVRDLDPHTTGQQAFVVFKKGFAFAARSADRTEIASQVMSLDSGKEVPPDRADLAACLLRRYVLAFYGPRMVADLQALVGFQTFVTEGKANWDQPEFARQREWLERRAAASGLVFRGYDGRVEEITLQADSPTAPILALLTHGDVQGVEGQTWSSPPFEGKLVDGKIIGRGTEDDKGPIVATLYALAALRDAAWPLRSTVKLLVANGEESSWEEIPYYLERAKMPDLTVGFDAAFPVTFAQKGWGLLTFRAQPVASPKEGDWKVVKIEGGSGMSIIAERGTAWLARNGDAKRQKGALAELQKKASAWAADHRPAKLDVSLDGDKLKVEAIGRGGHSSAPASGHNALGDLTAFLASLDLELDSWGALASFTGIAVGTETDGKSLGIAYRDALTGDMTANLSFVQDEKGVPTAHVNIRRPRGITKEAILKAAGDRTATFARRTGATIAIESDLRTEPHVAPVEGEPVATLLAVWQEVTGQPGKPIAIGGGTQARLFQNGVDFGPAMDMVHYRGHGTDEYLTPDELKRIAELNVTAIWRLAGPKAP